MKVFQVDAGGNVPWVLRWYPGSSVSLMIWAVLLMTISALSPMTDLHAYAGRT